MRYRLYAGSIGVATIFDWGGKPQITCNDVITIFGKKFLQEKDIVDGEIRSRGLCVGT